MREIVFNEIEQIENILASKNAENVSIKQLLMLLVKYTYPNSGELSVKKYKRNIQDKVLTLKMQDGYEEYLYDSYIEKLCRNIKNGKLNKELKNITKIDITKKEMNIVKQGITDREKKLLFTLFVLAKSILVPTGWVNYEDNQILQYGNLKGCRKTDYYLMIHKLYKKGLMDFNHKIDSPGLKVELQDDLDNVEICITNFKNFGNQCLSYLKPGWKMCENCGRMIKVGNNKQKYCKKCAIEVEAKNKSIRNKKMYQNKKNSAK